MQQAMQRVEIEFGTQCRWLLRTAWIAQELLNTFAGELTEVALKPGTGGALRVRLNDELLADRKADGGFPDLRALKQAIRDGLAPGRSLGHSECAS